MLERLLRAIEGNRFFFLASSLVVCIAWCWFFSQGWRHFESQYRLVNDPLVAVAGRFGMRVEDLEAANPEIKDHTRLKKGDTILVPFPSGKGPPTLKRLTLETYPEVELAPFRMASGAILAANNALLIIFYVFRRRSDAVATDLVSVVLGHLGTWFPLITMAFAPQPPVSDAWVVPGTILMAANFLVSTAGIISLGRSWGIIPANRGVKRGGLYRFVRHPIYANYMLLYGNAALLNVNLGTVLVAIFLPVLLFARAVLEERVLMEDPVYAEYARSVPWRFVPFVA